MLASSLDSLRKMAEKVSFVSFDVIQYQNYEMKSLWYKHEAIDLYYFEKGNGEIAKIHLSIMGQVLEWNPYDLVRTGLLIEEERAGGVFEVIQYDTRRNEKSFNQALLVVENAFSIPEKEREKLLRCLRAKFTPITFWQKLKKRIKG